MMIWRSSKRAYDGFFMMISQLLSSFWTMSCKGRRHVCQNYLFVGLLIPLDRQISMFFEALMRMESLLGEVTRFNLIGWIWLLEHSYSSSCYLHLDLGLFETFGWFISFFVFFAQIPFMQKVFAFWFAHSMAINLITKAGNSFWFESGAFFASEVGIN